MLQTTSARTADFKQRPTAIAAFLRDIQERLAQHASTHGAELTIERAPGELRALANDGALHQILLNLVDTAARAAVAGGSIRMWCESNAHVVALRMRGAGPGDPRLQDHAVILATREVARTMGGDVKVGDGTYTIELRRTA
jgi:C4-dicarboxylate-specific signal transduction histidine kinase